MKYIEPEIIPALAAGGQILGAGGGGSKKRGMDIARDAYQYGRPSLVSLDELGDDDLIITMSAVGSPAAAEQYAAGDDFRRALELVEGRMGKRAAALITNETGGASIFNAFPASAAGNIPMLDAACNGRAHPLGTMGAMGLAEDRNYQTFQGASGGNPEKGNHVEILAAGSVEKTSSLVRSTAVLAGGLVAVARNPVNCAYIRDHGALGVLSGAESLGRAFLNAPGPAEKLRAVAEALGGGEILAGRIDTMVLETIGGLDRGRCTLRAGDQVYTLHIWNEYMALEQGNRRLATFPDFIMTFDDAAEPLPSSELREGMEISLIHAPGEQLKLGAGMKEESGYEAAEAALGIDILSYSRRFIKPKG
jgi:DUF917 family protein